MNSRQPRFCSWGMYAFDESLQSAWQALFNAFRERVTERFALKKTLRFDTDETTLRDRDLLIGQTCGYPLIRFYKDNLVPLCAPVFDVPGCDDIFYRSAVIVAADSGFRSLPDCAGTAVAINGTDSNSGMNLLRDAVRGCANTNPFFASTIVTGSHLGSIAAVAEHRVDVAAIDCVDPCAGPTIAPATDRCGQSHWLYGQVSGSSLCCSWRKFQFVGRPLCRQRAECIAHYIVATVTQHIVDY